MLAFTQTPSPQTALTHMQNEFCFHLYFKALKEHRSDFQRWVSSLGQRYCVVYHIALTSMYIRQVKMAHTRFNPHAWSLLSPHCMVTIQNLTKTQFQVLKGTLQHKELLEGIRPCTNVPPLLAGAQAQKPMVLQCNTHTLLYYGTFLYYYSGEEACSESLLPFLDLPHITFIFTLPVWIWSSWLYKVVLS